VILNQGKITRRKRWLRSEEGNKEKVDDEKGEGK
jgi:hypothetical protein